MQSAFRSIEVMRPWLCEQERPAPAVYRCRAYVSPIRRLSQILALTFRWISSTGFKLFPVCSQEDRAMLVRKAGLSSVDTMSRSKTNKTLNRMSQSANIFTSKVFIAMKITTQVELEKVSTHERTDLPCWLVGATFIRTLLNKPDHAFIHTLDISLSLALSLSIYIYKYIYI